MQTSTTPVEANDLQAPFDGLLESLGDLVAAKTRFERTDITVKASSAEKAPYRLDSTYAVGQNVESYSISGTFSPLRTDKSAIDPIIAANDDAVERREASWRKLLDAISKSEAPWFKVALGISSRADRRHWELSSHIACGGMGKTRCTMCHGDGRVTCSRCIGSGEMTCDSYGCSFGTKTCSRCNGTCQISVGVWRTAYDANGQTSTVYRTEYHSCDNSSCMSGRVQCSQCFGRARVRCTTCSAMGKITCGHCAGSGSIRCEPCHGTGETGTVARGHSTIDVEHQLVIPEHGCPELPKIAQREGSAEIVALMSHVSAVNKLQAGTATQRTTAQTQRHAELDIFRMTFECGGVAFQVVAYGSEARLWTVDGIVEHLLADDLKTLEESIANGRKDGWLSRDRTTITDSLKNVIASEINSDLLNPKCQTESQASYPDAVSQEYIERLHKAVRAALNLVVIRNAKEVSWRAAPAVLAISILVWAIYGGFMGWLVGLGVIGVSELARRILLDRETKRITQTNEGRALLKGLASTGWADRGAKALIALPAFFLLWAAMVLVQGAWSWTDAKAAQEEATLVPEPERLDNAEDGESGSDE